MRLALILDAAVVTGGVFALAHDPEPVDSNRASRQRGAGQSQRGGDRAWLG